MLAAVAFGAPGAARADTFAQSILVIDHFRLLHANGTLYTGSDFSMLASANLTWSINLTALTTGAAVFASQPAQLNAPSIVSRNGALGGATTSMLSAGDIYQVSIAQPSYASASQNQQVAEPASLAAFGAGLLAMAALGRRRWR